LVYGVLEISKGDITMSTRNKKRLTVKVEDDFAIVSLEDMEIWDGADLALLRESLTGLIEREKYRAIGVDLSPVKYLPSGFFGMLFEWYEQGLRIRLDSPQDNVQQMLWFRMFFASQGGLSYLLTDERMRTNTPNDQIEFHRREFCDDTQDDTEESESIMQEHLRNIKYGLPSGPPS
jgi:hypothetical protein